MPSPARWRLPPQCAEALEGLEGYSHLVVLCYFHKLRPEQMGPLKVQPRRLLQRGFTRDILPWLGVFALDSPTRPNPIGLTVVRFVQSAWMPVDTSNPRRMSVAPGWTRLEDAGAYHGLCNVACA